VDARAVGRIGLRSLIAAASAATLVLAGTAWGLQHRLEVGRVVTNAIPDAVPTPVGEEFTALLVGLDARTDANGNPLPQALLDALHAGPDEGQLHTDTIMLLHVPAERNGSAVAISIPRDSFVQIAGGRGKHKINSAYQRGLKDAEDALEKQGITGPELDRRGREAGRGTLIATVQDLTGLTVNHFAEINLAGFVELTDALGGVPVCLNEPVKDDYSGIDLPAGPQTVSGPGRSPSSASGTASTAATSTASPASRPSPPAWPSASPTPAPCPTRPSSTSWSTSPPGTSSWTAAGTSTSSPSSSARSPATRSSSTPSRPVAPDLRTPVDGVAVEIDPAAVRRFAKAEVAATEQPAATSTIAAPDRTGYTGGDAPASPTPAPTPAPTPTPTPTAPPISTAAPPA
jgi:LCP family protein required for cell wall assembly